MAATEPIELEIGGAARAFLGDVESALAGDTDASQLHRSLVSSADAFLNLLAVKPNNPNSRAIVESGNIHTTQGLITLDKTPDVEEILLLSDELKLDELSALALVLDAQQQTGAVSAAAAAGFWYDERMSMVQALLALLHAQVACGGGDLPTDMYDTIGSFNASMLQKEQNKATLVISRLADLIQADSVLVSSDSRLSTVIAIYGRPIDRASIIQRECTALCQCLFYACCIKQRMTAADVERLLGLLHHMALHARTPGPHQLIAQHQANLVLLSVLLTLLPLEDAQGQALAEDDKALRALAQTASVDSKEDDIYAAVVRLAWGMLPLCCDDQSLTKRGLEDVKAALSGGALGFLADGVMNSIQMSEEDEDIRLTAASVVHQLLVLFIEVAPEGMEQMKKATLDGAEIEAAAAAADVNGDSSMMMVVADTPPPPSPDNLAALLNCLAAVFAARPGLFLDEDRRSTLISELMGDIGQDVGLKNVPSIFLGYLAVLTALAKTEVGARLVFTQLRGDNAPPLVSWRRMFSTFQAVIQKYSPGNADFLLPANDTKALCAFAHLYSRIMLEGNADEVASWLHQLDDEAGISPSWELLFQVMCCPVPQSLKAALDNAIAAMARRPDLAAALWQRLLACVVVQPYAMAGTAAGDAAVPRYDLIYQLNEIESRSEDYQEALAFIQLLNALWRSGGAAMADDGRSVSHLTRFVRDEVLATVFQRTFKDDSQRWNIIAAGLDHCRLCLEHGAAPNSPGLDVLLDLLGEKNAARAALVTLSFGVDLIAAERHSVKAGAAKEGAALAALRLLVSVFSRDAEVVSNGAYETFDAVLRHDRSRIPALLEYVRYPFNPQIQEEALRLTAAIAERTPQLVQVLLTVASSSGDRLQDSFAVCMDDAVSSSSSPIGDSRAALILDLLLHCLQVPTPNLTELLCGFWVDAGVSPLMFQDPGALHTPLRVIMGVLSNHRNATLRPRVFEQCLEVVYELSNRFETSPAMLDLLRSYHGVLVPLLDAVACTPLPERGSGRVSALHQRAWLLQVLALELRRADAALVSEKESLQSILSALFGKRNRFIDILAVAVGDMPNEPQLGAGASGEVRRMIQALDVETLLRGGDPLLDVVALKDELLRRFNDWVGRHGAPGEALKEAGRATLAYAAEFNTYAEEMGGRLAMLEAWQSVVSVAFTDRFDLLGDSSDLVFAAAEHALEAAALVLQGPAAGLAPPLCCAVEALFARLQDQAISSLGLWLPSRCHSLLHGLLAIMWEGRSQESVRLVLYNALMNYLAMCCKGPSLQLEEGNVSILHANARLLQVLAQDAVSANPTMATAALTALAALVGADPSTVLADEVHRIALPARLLQDLADQSPEALLQPPPAGQAATLVTEAKLALLLRLSLAGPPSQRAASAQKLFSLQALPRLAACRVLDLQPEEPGFNFGGGSLRQRLGSVVTPALRLVLALATTLPHSNAVREQTAGFVEAHARAIARVLRDSWEGGDAELEQATLAVQLLCELRTVAPAVQEAAYRAASRFLAANSSTSSKTLALRCALASYLRILSVDGVVFPCVASAAGEVSAPTLFLIKDGLLQAAVHDLPDAAGEKEVKKVGYLIEHLLAILFQHLRKNSDLKGMRKSDLDQLRRLAEPAIAALEREKKILAVVGADECFELLIRRVKECFMTVDFN